MRFRSSFLLVHVRSIVAASGLYSLSFGAIIPRVALALRFPLGFLGSIYSAVNCSSWPIFFLIQILMINLFDFKFERNNDFDQNFISSLYPNFNHY